MEDTVLLFTSAITISSRPPSSSLVLTLTPVRLILQREGEEGSTKDIITSRTIRPKAEASELSCRPLTEARSSTDLKSSSLLNIH